MRKFSKAADEAEVNMTPMLDIVFIMLIFFIVTASFTREEGLDMNRPPPDAPPPPPDDKVQNLLVRIDGNNRIRVGVRLIDIRSVRANIQQWYAANPTGTLVIQPQPDSHAGLVVQIYDQGQQVGVANISIAEPN